MSANAIARRYAKALVQLAAEEGAVDKFHGELARVEAAFCSKSRAWVTPFKPGLRHRGQAGDSEGCCRQSLSFPATIRNFLLLFSGEEPALLASPQSLAVTAFLPMNSPELSGRSSLRRCLLMPGRSRKSRERWKRVPAKRVISESRNRSFADWWCCHQNRR